MKPISMLCVKGSQTLLNGSAPFQKRPSDFSASEDFTPIHSLRICIYYNYSRQNILSLILTVLETQSTNTVAVHVKWCSPEAVFL